MKLVVGSTLTDDERPNGTQTGQQPCGSIPPGTRQFINLTDAAEWFAVARVTAKRWWHEGRLLGCIATRGTRSRVLVPIEVVDFYLRYRQLPTKRDLFEAGVLTREFLLDLTGPDGGLTESSGSTATPRVTPKSR